MTGWAGATAQQASADETRAALGGAPRPNCEKSVGQQLLQRSNAQATLGRSPPSRLAQTTRIAVYRRITTYRTRSLAANNPATRHLICRGVVCTFPEFKAAGLKMRLSLSPGPPSHAADDRVHDLLIIGAGPAGLAEKASTSASWTRSLPAVRPERAPGSRTIWDFRPAFRAQRSPVGRYLRHRSSGHS